MRIVTIVQARQTSKRLPNKVLKKINQFSIIEIIVKRLKKLNLVNDIIVAIPDNKMNDKLSKHLIEKKIKIFRGSEKNVLDRYYQAAKKNKADVIVRITADCPFVDIKIIENGLKIFLKNRYYFVSNTIKRTYPDGLDISIFSFDLLKKRWAQSKSNDEKEHVTSFMKKIDKRKIFNFEYSKDLSNYRWTLDNNNDLKKIKKIFEKFKPDIYFSWKKILLKGFK